MIKSIIVIGIGSLGGYVAYALSELEYIEKIAIIDDDIVEDKNINNSIYTNNHIGKLKVDCLSEIIEFKNKNIIIEKYNGKYISNCTIMPMGYDLILDCRDYTYSRSGEIDIRLYISSRYLILDCKRQIQYEKENNGKYIERLKKTDLRNAGNIVSSLIDNNLIKRIIEGGLVNKFDLDFYKINDNNIEIIPETGAA
jgi:hypothetical protein